MGPAIQNPKNFTLCPDVGAILQAMFSTCQRVVIKQDFSALGFSGSHVYLVHPIREDGSPALPSVVKIASVSLIDKEWHAYQACIQDRLPSVAKVRGKPTFLSGGQYGGLCYDLFGEEIFEVQPLRIYAGKADQQALDFVMADQLLPSLRRLWDFGRQSRAEFPLHVCYDQILPINLRLELFSPSSEDDVVLISPDVPLPSPSIERGTVVRLEGFVISKVDLARQTVTLNLPTRKDGVPQSYFVRVQSVEALDAYHVGQQFPAVTGIVVDTREARLQREAQAALGPEMNLVQPLLTTRDGVTLPNPWLMLPDILRETRHVWISHIHGDLNLGNILVESQTRKVGLIDFAEVREGYILHDFLRLETEVMIHLLPDIIHQYNLPLVPTFTIFVNICIGLPSMMCR